MSTAKATVYKTAPNAEHRAARELESHGINAVVPFDDSGKRKRVTAPGYVFAGRPLRAAFVKHVRHEVGTAPVDALARLYVFKPRKPASRNPYKIGQHVTVGEVPGVIAAIEGDICTVVVTMLGKQHLRPLHYARLRPG